MKRQITVDDYADHTFTIGIVKLLIERFITKIELLEDRYGITKKDRRYQEYKEAYEDIVSELEQCLTYLLHNS